MPVLSYVHHLFKQNPQSARRNNFSGEQISWGFLLLPENLSASNYPGAAFNVDQCHAYIHTPTVCLSFAPYCIT